MFNLERRARKPSLLACLGALLAAASIGLSAYASHGVADPLAQQHLNMAALYAFAHGAVLVALGPRAQGRSRTWRCTCCCWACCCFPAAWWAVPCGSGRRGWRRSGHQHDGRVGVAGDQCVEAVTVAGLSLRSMPMRS